MFNEDVNSAIVRTELDSVFFQRFDEVSPFPSTATAQTAEIFKPLETTHAAYIEEVYKGSGLFPAVGETTSVPLSTPRVTNKLTTSVTDYASSIELSKNLFDDNMHGVWAETVRDFADKARITQTSNAFAVFRNAFTTTLTADGSALIGTHTLIGGGTQSNSVSGVLNSDNLNTAVVSLMQQKDQAGVVRGNTPAILLVPPQLLKKAIELTDSALIADSGNNAINVYRSAMGITVYSSPYLGSAVSGGSDTAWFLMARNHGIRRLIRQGIQTALRSWEFSNNRTYLYQANFRETVYAVDWAGIVGSTGT